MIQSSFVSLETLKPSSLCYPLNPGIVVRIVDAGEHRQGMRVDMEIVHIEVDVCRGAHQKSVEYQGEVYRGFLP